MPLNVIMTFFFNFKRLVAFFEKFFVKDLLGTEI